MGVYLCVGQPIHAVSLHNATHIDYVKTFKEIQDWIVKHGKVLIFLGEGQHKIKRKAEQTACSEALQKIEHYASL
jgi:dsRNA-specific ribonuclease